MPRTAAFRLKKSRRYRKLMRELDKLEAAPKLSRAAGYRLNALKDLKTTVKWFVALRHPKLWYMSPRSCQQRMYEAVQITVDLYRVKTWKGK